MRSLLLVLALAFGAPARAGEPTAAQPTPVVELTDVRFWLDAQDVQRPHCGGCAYATWVHIGSYRVHLYGPAGARFERFVVGGGGRITFDGVSPDGRTVHAVLHPGTVPGAHKVTALFHLKDGRTGASSKRFQVRAPSREPDCMPGPCSDPMGHDERDNHGLEELSLAPPAPTVTCRLKASGPLRFTTTNNGPIGGGWPQELRFVVALPDSELRSLTAPEDGSAGHAPTVTCTTGDVTSITAVDATPGIRDPFAVVVNAAPPEPPRRLVAGNHRCVVSYRVGDPAKGERPATRTGKLSFRIDKDGYLHVAPPACPKTKPAPAPQRPLPDGTPLPLPPQR